MTATAEKDARTTGSRRHSARVVTMPAEQTRHDEWSQHLVAVGERGDREAFAHLFNHFGPLIKSYALSRTPLSGQPQAADELVQEAMIKIWRKAGSFDPTKASASTWIFTLARNCRTDMLRRQQRHDGPLTSDDIWLEDPAGDQPYISLQQRRHQSSVRQSLSELPVDQSQVLAKVYMEGKTHSEVADELGLPLGTVKSRVRLAMQKLKLLLTA